MKTLKLLLLFSLLSSFGHVQAQLNNDPDEFETDNGTVTIHPILHGTAVLEWNDLTVYIDPYGGGELFEDFADPNLIFITHAHGDHLDMETLNAINIDNATFIVPESVSDSLPDNFSESLQIMANGESIDVQEISVLAIPMYNLPQEEDAYHPKGWGNGYILTIGGKSFYFSGDTEDIPEMRSLTDIDVAFVSMNLPYTMDIKQAASAVLDFEPEVIYPYHHRGQDIQQFKELVDVAGKNIEVRLKDWYPGK